MKKLTLLAALLLTCTQTFAATNRVLDGATITNGAATLTLPTTTDTLLGKDTTDTLTNKSMSGSSNTFTNIPAGTAITGQLPIANGGTGASTQAGAANAVLPSQATANGKYLTSDGTDVSWATIPSGAPTVVGSQASPSSVTAAGGLTFAAAWFTYQFIVGSPGAVTVTANPQIAAGTAVGQKMTVVGTSGTNTVTLAHGNGLSLNGAWVGGNNSALDLVWDGALWTEVARR